MSSHQSVPLLLTAYFIRKRDTGKKKTVSTVRKSTGKSIVHNSKSTLINCSSIQTRQKRLDINVMFTIQVKKVMYGFPIIPSAVSPKSMKLFNMHHRLYETIAGTTLPSYNGTKLSFPAISILARCLNVKISYGWVRIMVRFYALKVLLTNSRLILAVIIII